MIAIIFLLLTLWAPCAFGADAKISDFTEDTAPTSDDLRVTVDDPGGTPANRKVTASNLGKAVVGAQVTNTESLGKIPIGQGDGTAVWSDPLVQGVTAHDADATSTAPVLGGCYASAAAPTDVSADGDAVRAWCLRNGARAVSVTNTVTVDGSGVTQPVSGTVAATQSGTWTVQPGNTANTTAWKVDGSAVTQPVSGNVGILPLTSGGTSLSRTVSGASTNATNIKASAGQVYSIQASNVNAAARYLHLYNNSGSPTCNANIVATYIIPGATTGDGNNIKLNGAAFSSGIAICITTGVDGTGNVSANENIVMIEYK